jgi:uncharacterized protein YjbJ (UPF0337 family)
MANTKAVKNEIAGKAKRIVGEVLDDQKRHDEGDAQERQSEERNDPADVKPFGNLDKLT